MDIVFHLVGGLGLLWDPKVLLLLVGAVALGILVGAIPGLTATLAIALLLPFTFGLDPVEGIAVLMGIYIGGIYGGSITAMLVRIPGAPANAMTMLDGNPMVRAGHAEAALGLGLFSSVVGGLIGGLILLFLAPQLASLSLRFRSPEMFSLIILALVLLAVVTSASIKRGVAATLLGLMIATVGLDPMRPIPRFTFGSYDLLVGVPILPLVVGLFALSEVFLQADDDTRPTEANVRPRLSQMFDFIPYVREVGWRLFAKSSAIGASVGALPGGGAAVAAFVAYGEAKRSSKHPEQFGSGTPEGIIAPESANNAMIGGSLIPMLAFGIPGDAVTAVILGALLIQGIVPGPQLLTNPETLLVPLLLSYFLCFGVLMIVGSLVLPWMSQMTKVNRGILMPVIASVAVVAGFASEGTLFAVGLTVAIGVVGYLLMRLDIPVVPVLLGAILGPMLEVNFRRSLIISDGDLSIFIRSPLSGLLLLVTVLFIAVVARKSRQGSVVAGAFLKEGSDTDGKHRGVRTS